MMEDRVVDFEKVKAYKASRAKQYLLLRLGLPNNKILKSPDTMDNMLILFL